MEPLKFAKILLSMHVLTITITGALSSDPQYFYHLCPNTTTFVTNSTYQLNLNILLSSLSSYAIAGNDFYLTSVGQYPDVAYGLYLCRGDVSAQVCRQCVTVAWQYIIRICPVEKAAVVWYDQCLLRYSDSSFDSVLDNHTTVLLSNISQLVSNSSQLFFDQQTVVNLGVTASKANISTNKFATKIYTTGFPTHPPNQDVYCLMQCTQDLTDDDCYTCLQGTIKLLPDCCSGKQGARILTPSCITRIELYEFFNATPELIPAPVQENGNNNSATTNGNNNSATTNTIKVIAGTSSIIPIVLVCCCAYSIYRRKILKKGVQMPYLITIPSKLNMPLAEILAATQNFNTMLLIGEGGFGNVYKGTLQNGTKVAVKRYRTNSSHGQGLYEFQNEVLVQSKIRHRHLLSLIGYCYEDNEMILVYEFMEKGTLRDHLYSQKESLKSSSKPPPLSWKQRLEICLGSAKGLHYLHTFSEGGIIHHDIKSTNILLDEHFVAKVADFGLSQLGAPDPVHSSGGVKGSFGYLDPQYFKTLQLTEKSDVYSFGVVLLEVLCARPAIVNSSQMEEINLADWGMFWQKKGQLEKIIDPLLADHINPNSLRKFGEIVDKCLRPEGDERPSMLDVHWDLEYALQLQTTPAQREPYDDTTTVSSKNFILPVAQKLQTDCSINEMSFSNILPR